MRTTMRFWPSLIVSATAALVGTAPLWAQGKGEGGVVLRDGAPVYSGSTTSTVVATLKWGDAVAGVTTAGIFSRHFEFEEEDGRIPVFCFKPPNYEGIGEIGWMDPNDVARFLYDCGCDTESKGECRPYKTEFLKGRWNACFREAYQKKLAELEGQAQHEAGPRARTGGAPGRATPGQQPPKEKALTNDDVVALVKLDLGDDLVIAKIQQAPVEALDVSTEAIVKLRQQGVSKAVIDAMLKRASQRK